ncbi:MAG: UTRA domain-containing protein [Rhodobacteraceae bacterium]|nr:UTRA domain-containing protein [Paracoccaceae bacterium]MBR9820535.1 UTRA domain-containing protein [Paracoccaceae bacterium]
MTSPTPARTWRGIHAELTRRINDGVWRPGELVPNEAELAEEFGCARATVNRAMRELAETGRVDRKRKAGTRVALHPSARVVLDIPVIRREVEARGASWHYSLILREEGPAPLALTARLGLAQDAPMLHLACLHYADAQPFLHEDRWINIAAVPGLLDTDFSVENANEWLIRNAPYTGGDIAFSALAAGAELAALLEAAEGAALFTLDRTTWNGEVPITSVRLSYAPGYRMHTRI